MQTKVIMSLRHFTSKWSIVTIIVILCSTLPVLAEQASAESTDFTVNTIPEPSTLLLLLLVAGLLLRRLRCVKILCIALLALWVSMPALQTHAAAPIVTNVTAQQQAQPSLLVDIYYDLFDEDGDSQCVMVDVSTNSGQAYNVVASNFTGDVGAGIVTGINKHIVWDPRRDCGIFTCDTVRVKITVDDEMVMIPAGSFNMGNCKHPSEGADNELPVHSVYISAFYIDKYEITKEKWDEVYNWAILNGYSFDTTGSTKTINHPVQMINWYDCAKWCNARSEKEGLIPCYYTESTKTNIYKTGQLNVSNNWVMWDANGYRLPIEAEWEKAARGGAAGYRFPSSDTIAHSQANYYSSDSYSYDVSPTRGYHPDYDDGGEPYTSPVGSFAPNGYGLYDMAGNINEWCWDWHDADYYSSSPANDPLGPSTGVFRVLRGGSWEHRAKFIRCTFRFGFTPGSWYYNHIGFRCVRRTD
jgi:formylglycine-generating enzyme required for sulfatase activity